MVCSHYPTPTPTLTPTKNGLYRIVWRCSHCTDTDADTDTDANGLQTHFVGVGVGIGVGQCEHTISQHESRRDTDIFIKRPIAYRRCYGKDMSKSMFSAENIKLCFSIHLNLVFAVWIISQGRLILYPVIYQILIFFQNAEILI